MKKLLLALLMLTSLFADKTVIKSVTVNQMLYSDKTLMQLEEIALQKAKYAAAKEIFGEFLLSETVMVNGKVLDDIVKEKTGGVIHIKGEPKYSHGANFGDLKVTIEAYATDADIEDMSPHFIVVNDFVYANPNIPLSSLRNAAEDAFIIEAISRKKPSARRAHIAEVRKMALSIAISKFDYDEEKATYIISGKVEYIPAFLRHAKVINSNSISDYKDRNKEVKVSSQRQYTRLNNADERINRAKRGFYGIWSGFIMKNDGGSMDLEIEISDSGLTNIVYNSLNCGGELIIDNKTTRIVDFKEKITYGNSACSDVHTIRLKKVNSTQVLFFQYDEDKNVLAKGSLYSDD